ncbi:MAG: DUF935 family protein [Candidatus Sumerlaeia bacterium]|nr:DUF935 family protein [Candidatus Sumerlaeia bacterium]
MPSPSAKVQPLVNPAEQWWAGQGLRDDRSPVALLQAESSSGRVHRSVYELYAEMEEKDGHLFSLLQTRLNGLLGLPRQVLPARSGDETARHAAQFVEDALHSIPRFEGLLRALLEAISKGFSVVELVWDYNSAGHLVPVNWIAHPQEWFLLDQAGGLNLLSPPFRSSSRAREVDGTEGPGRHPIPARQHFPAPPRKFIALTFGADFRNPYGRGLAQHAYWMYWFKKNALKSWGVYNEKHGSPTTVATCAPGISGEDQRRLTEILDALHAESHVILPESIRLQLLESNRSGDGRCYRDLLDWCNDEMSKIILGATLTSGEGRRSGSLALGNIHQLVRQDYIDADARLLETTINETLIGWICEANLPADAPRPRLAIETEGPEDLYQRIRVDQALLGLGVSLPQSYFYTRYGRPAPQPGELPLKYDDANFYQYHLQFGVLTINEVRERLQLPPVPWGGMRTADHGVRVEGVPGSREDTGNRPV